jgi:choline-sulfatase
MTDQQSYYMISAITNALDPASPYANNNYFKTPNLDRLVKSGYTFSNCYAANPVSGPSRYALLTGESPNAVGMTGNFSPGGENGEKIMSIITTRAMGTLFKNAGYQTCYGGKVHLAWADGRSGKGSINDAPFKYGFDNYMTEDDRAILAQKGAEFITTYKDKDPFLLFLSFMNPHDICMTQLLFNNKKVEEFEGLEGLEWRSRINQIAWSEVYYKMDHKKFEGEELAKLPANSAPTDKFPLALGGRTVKFDDEYRMKVHLWFYYRLVEQVDAEIGQVLDALENSPHRDNTIIVFTSDHGEMAGSHGLTGKNFPYEECQKVPMIFAGKGVKKGVIDNTTPVCNGWDLLPTMLDIAGLEIPKELHGMSLYKQITTGKSIKRKYLYYETVNSYGVLENGRYKYTRLMPSRKITDGNEALFDLEKDPGELHNLVFDKSYTAKLSKLRTALAAEMKFRGTSFEPNNSSEPEK